MIGELPKGWTKCTLYDSFENPKANIVDGPFGSNLKSTEYLEEGIPVIRLQNIDRDKFTPKNLVYVSERKFSELKRHTFRSGDIIMTKLGDPLGKACIIPDDFMRGVLVADLVRIRIDSKLWDSKFLMYQINSPEIILQLRVLTKGTTRPRVNLKHVRILKFSLPPLPEQKRIVEKLDKLFGELEELKIRLVHIPTLLKNFRQAVLTQAVTGKLTEEWRVGNVDECMNTDKILDQIQKERIEKGIKFKKNPKVICEELFHGPLNWRWFNLQDVSLKITDGAHNTPKTYNNGYPYLMAKDLTGGFMDFSQNQFLKEDDHRELWNKCRPEIGDLLVVNIGAGTGNNVIIDVTFEFSFKNIAIIKRSKIINPYYLKHYFNHIKDYVFEKQTRGGAQPFLSLTSLKELSIVIPPLEEQQEIVRRVEALFAQADAIEEKYEVLKAKVETLPQSILAKAFRGELVEQLDTDGSAQELLEEIGRLKGK